MKWLVILVAFILPAVTSAQDGDVESQAGTSDQPNAVLYSVSMIRSYNYSEQYVRHSNYLGEISPMRSDLDREDASFTITPGLADPNKISFESANFPGYFLRDKDGRVRLHRNDGSQAFNDDATFAQVPGIADPSWSSFESHRYPGKFLRHRNFNLWVEKGHGELFRNDATFVLQSSTEDEVQTLVADDVAAPSCNLAFRSFCYAILRNVPKTFEQAEQFCAGQYGGHLASIHSDPENGFVSAVVDPNQDGNITAWIGGFAPVGFLAKDKGTYRWTDGTPWAYSRWRTGTSEPNATPSGSPGGVQFWPQNNGESSGWNDAPQNLTQDNTVCKWRAEEDVSSPYTLYGNSLHAGFPWLDSKIGILSLTPEDAYKASGVAFMKESTPIPFVLSFEFKTWDRDGGDDKGRLRYSADGISVIFAEDDSDYEAMHPPAGGAQGFFTNGSSLALRFKTWDKRRVILNHGFLKLAGDEEPGTYTGGDWQKVRVEVNPDSIIVLFDDRVVLYWRGTVPITQPHLAFGAATGNSNSLHLIRNVVLEND
jgi:hypothetical protein